MKRKSQMVIGGLLSEAWARSIGSYARSLEYYNARVRDGTQPSTPFINLFDVKQQTILMVVNNIAYLFITMLFLYMMKKRLHGLQLRWFLAIYDAINVSLAAYILVSVLKYKLGHGGLLLCNPISYDIQGYKFAKVIALFSLQKYFEFLDTWFFILRKSSRQVTFLHLFHHSSITIVVGSLLPFDYNGDMYLAVLTNCATNFLVYLHYLFATLGLSSWWAPYITSVQLAQFVIIFSQNLISYRIGPTCGSPDFAKVLMIIYMGSLIGLFGNFVFQRYVLRRSDSALDNLCGVIKRPANQSASDFETQESGILELDKHGAGTVILPEEFPDPATSGQLKGDSHSTRQISFQVIYSLTAIGAPMPNLHVSKEVSRYRGTVVESRGDTSLSSSSKGAKCVSIADGGAQERRRKDEEGKLSDTDAALETREPGLRNATKADGGGASGMRRSAWSTGNLSGFLNATGGGRRRLHDDRVIDSSIVVPMLGLFSGLGSQAAVGSRGEEVERVRTGLAVLTATSVSAPSLSSHGAAAEVGASSTELKSKAELDLSKHRPVEENSLPTSAIAQASAMTERGAGAGERARSNSMVASAVQGAMTGLKALADPRRRSHEPAVYRPLYFSVAGGKPRGKVSWSLHTVPTKALTINKRREEAMKALERDWRADIFA